MSMHKLPGTLVHHPFRLGPNAFHCYQFLMARGYSLCDIVVAGILAALEIERATMDDVRKWWAEQ